MVATSGTISIQVSQTGAQAVQRAIEDIGTSAGLARTAIETLRGVLATIGVASGLREILELADSFTAITNKIGLMTSSVAESGAVLAELARGANDTRTSLDQLTGVYQRVAISTQGLGLSQRQIIQGAEGVAAALARIASTGQETTRAMQDVSHALETGVLSGQALREPTMQIVLKDINDGIKELAKSPAGLAILKKSLTDTEVAAISASQGMGAFRGAVAAGHVTAGLMIAALGENLPNALRLVQQQAFTTTQAVTVLWNKMTEGPGAALHPVQQALADSILAVANNLDAVGKYAAVAGTALAAAFGPAILRSILAVGGALIALVASNPLLALLSVFAGLVAYVIEFGEGTESAGAATSNLTALWGGLKGAVAASIPVVVGWADAAAGALITVGKGVDQLSRQAFGRGFVDTAKDSLGKLVDILETFVRLVVGLMAGMGAAIIAVFPSIGHGIEAAFVDYVINPVTARLERWANAVVDTLNPLIAYIGKHLDRVSIPVVTYGEAPQTAGDAFGKAFSDAWNLSGSWMDKLNRFFSDLGKAASAGAGSAGAEAGKTFGQQFADGSLGQVQQAIYQIESGSGRRYNAAPYPGHSASGPMQMMPDTFQAVAPGGNISDPAQNMAAGNKLIAQYWEKYGHDPLKTAIAYAEGPAGLEKYLADPSHPLVNKGYDRTFTAVLGQIQSGKSFLPGAPNQGTMPASADLDRAGEKNFDDQYGTQFRKLEEQVSPTKKATEEYTKSLDLLLEAYVAGKIKGDEYGQMEATLTARTLAARDPMASLLKPIHEQIDALNILDPAERRVAESVQRGTDALIKQGVAPDATRLRAVATEQEHLKEVTAAADAVWKDSAGGALHDFEVKLEALDKRLASNTITVAEYGRAWGKAKADVLEKSDSMFDGIEAGLLRVGTNVGTEAKVWSDAVGAVFKTTEEYLANLASTGKGKFSDLMTSIKSDLTKAAFKGVESEVFGGLLGGASGASGSGRGGGGLASGGAQGMGLLTKLLGAGNGGGIFSGGSKSAAETPLGDYWVSYRQGLADQGVTGSDADAAMASAGIGAAGRSQMNATQDFWNGGGQGGALAGVGDWFRGLFATGGQFQVPGQGGTDTVPVSFMATPGERVTIETPLQQASSRLNGFRGGFADGGQFPALPGDYFPAPTSYGLEQMLGDPIGPTPADAAGWSLGRWGRAGIGLGALGAGGLAWYLTSQRKKPPYVDPSYSYPNAPGAFPTAAAYAAGAPVSYAPSWVGTDGVFHAGFGRPPGFASGGDFAVSDLAPFGGVSNPSHWPANENYTQPTGGALPQSAIFAQTGALTLPTPVGYDVPWYENPAITGAATQLAALGTKAWFGPDPALFGAGGLKGLLGFASGGEFDVGGHGGTDSSLVAFKASPGEHVSVGPQNVGGGFEGGDSSVNTNNYNFEVNATDAESFKRSQGQIMAMLASTTSRASQRNN